MNRRSLLSRPLRSLLAVTEPTRPQPPSVQRSTAAARTQSALAPYSGPWDREQAAHLLRRCLFGPTAEQIRQASEASLRHTVNVLTSTQPAPAPPLNFGFPNDPDVAIGSTWVDAPLSQGVNGYRRNSLQAWWAGLMINQGLSLTEKMTLFWHNHFATELGVYADARYGYKHLSMLRQHALGNFKTLVEEVTIDPAMLRYLNGNQNIVGRANENYARELFELFTIGKGPLIGPGNYTTYTEDDVLAAAKVLTGWRDLVNRTGPNANVRSQFFPAAHDSSNKSFSAAFNNQVIGDNGDQEYKDLINMIFSKDETARFICRKLYRWFVYYEIDAHTEEYIIDPLAQILIANNFEMKPVLETLFMSEHFFDYLNMGCVIKSPVDFSVSVIRQFQVEIPDAVTDLLGQYAMWFEVVKAAAEQQQNLLFPPGVAGWSAYYQAPQFHEAWISSATLTSRADFVKVMILQGIRSRRVSMQVDPLAFLEIVSDPMDPLVLIDEFVDLLLPQHIPQSQKDFLKEALLPGLPNYEWTIEYGDYLANPTDQNLKAAVEAKLRDLLVTLTGLAEYYLS
jgi:uncharacterized protein (DUF1800 family)